jgi:PAS domain S-box-containing protein
MHELCSGTAVFRAGPDGKVMEWNPAAERLTGIAAAQAEGRPCWEVIAGHDGRGGIVCHPACSILRLAREGWPVRCVDVHVRTPTGEKQISVSTIVVREDRVPMILHAMQDIPEPTVATTTDEGPPSLTPRQREILLFLVRGFRAREIATRLMLSETTVRNHIQAILLALGVHSQLEAVARAHRFGFAEDVSAA